MADNRYHDGGKPYPEGEERTRINAAFDRLFAALNAAGTLAKAWTLLEIGSRDLTAALGAVGQ